MKKLLTVVLAAACFAALAQDGVPYNPDFDQNGFISTPDLLSLLTLFGEEWSVDVGGQEVLMYSAGEMGLFDCLRVCNENHARIPTYGEIGIFENQLHAKTDSLYHASGSLTCEEGASKEEWWYYYHFRDGWDYRHIRFEFTKYCQSEDVWYPSDEERYGPQGFNYINTCLCIGLAPETIVD